MVFWLCAPPRKIATRSETARAILSGIEATEPEKHVATEPEEGPEVAKEVKVPDAPPEVESTHDQKTGYKEMA